MKPFVSVVFDIALDTIPGPARRIIHGADPIAGGLLLHVEPVLVGGTRGVRHAPKVLL